MSEWQCPPGFATTTSHEEGVVVAAPVIAPVDEQRPTTCERCGGQRIFDAALGKMKCLQCGSREALVNSGQHSQELFRETALQERGWGLALAEIECSNCGATITAARGHLATTCAFCASSQIVVREAAQEGLRPNAVIAFAVDHKRCQECAAAWLGRGFWQPKDTRLSLLNFHGVYMPHWLFTTTLDADWHAEAVQRDRKGAQKWRPIAGHAKDMHQDEAVAATDFRTVPPFEMADLVPYKSDYLVGWHARAYETRLEDAWRSAREDWRQELHKGIRQGIGRTHRNLVVKVRATNEHFRYALLPVYVASYRYKGGAYQVVVNGQTGEVSGQKPVDAVKLWGAALALLLPGLVMSILAFSLWHEGQFLAIALVALGVACAGYLLHSVVKGQAGL